jgi:hypothetical protein
MGVDPGNCPEGCTRTYELFRDPNGGPGISLSLQVTATLAGEHAVVTRFLENTGESAVITATLTVVEPPPTAVSLTSMTATGEPQAGFFEGSFTESFFPSGFCSPFWEGDQSSLKMREVPMFSGC